ncbi:hypothetical protein RN001_015187 [Aquatica leii]|uniref:Peptidase S1 domain-containing protein n=1 Tax=Aquatica leii TaxID=1421715 RepID=A0AAN7P1G7_9COLE|nr:hypothetical protein RN001_015187 [Aquatica leii]
MQHFLFLVTVACVFTHTTGRTLLNDKIVGGNVASVGQFPYQISLRQNKIHFCGGSIIDKNTLLTAAHCLEVFWTTDVTVIAGTNKLSEAGTQYSVSRHILHENWNPGNTTNDIAVIKVTSSIEFTTFVQAIVIDDSFIAAGTECVFSGWGYTSNPGLYSNDLLYYNASVVELNVCKEVFAQETYPVVDSNICAVATYGVGGCFGDGGDALVSNNKQIGISSWINPCGLGDPDVFTRVSYYSEWIQTQQALTN